MKYISNPEGEKKNKQPQNFYIKGFNKRNNVHERKVWIIKDFKETENMKLTSGMTHTFSLKMIGKWKRD
ncbi:unnamed protein product [Caretta caretta]